MFIQTEQTPNPDTLKFLPGQVVMAQGTAEYSLDDDVSSSPLAQQLFKVAGVQSVFFGQDFISVTKEADESWPALKALILGRVMDHFTSGLPVVSQAAEAPSAISSDDPISAEIIEILDSRVRPAVAADGGDIVFHRFEDGVVYLMMQGACAGCPSSTLTLKSGIENLLKHYVPEVVSVEAVN